MAAGCAFWLGEDVTYFVKETQLREYSIGDGIGELTISLEISPDVFPPPQQMPQTGRYLHVRPGESVIDIGTGSGILGIVAAKMGGQVCATDISDVAVTAASKNAIRNNVMMDVRQGDLFGSFPDKFDVIIGNLSQTILTAKARTQLNDLAPSVDGDALGNKQILRLLETAHRHMHDQSRLYVLVYTISDYQTTLATIAKKYHATQLATESEPVKEFVLDDLQAYLALRDAGIIKIYQKDGLWTADQFLFELTLRKEAS